MTRWLRLPSHFLGGCGCAPTPGFPAVTTILPSSVHAENASDLIFLNEGFVAPVTIDYKYRYLLDDWQKEAVEVLNEKFREQLRATDDVLMDFAEKAESGTVQNHFFDAQREIWLKMEDMSLDFHDLLTKHLSRFPQPSEDTTPTLGSETLSLVSIDLYERNLALNTLADKAEKANYQELYLLAQRLSVINNGKPVKMEDVPASPKHMCEIFARCVNRLSIENDALLVLYTLYDKYVLSALPELHEKLNQSLIKAGILPTLKYSVKNKGGSTVNADSRTTQQTEEPHSQPAPTMGGAPASAPHGPSTGGTTTSATSSGHQTPEELGAETMHRIQELLKANRRRRKRAPLPPGVTVASRQEVLQAADTVTMAQASSFPDSEILFEPVAEEALTQVQRQMAVQREAIKSKIGYNRLQDQQEDVIDLVGMLFEQMLDDETIPNAAKALLGHLHTPYIKIGLDDEDFLENPAHPARVFLDKAIAASAAWVDEADLKKGIYPFLKDMVYNIVRLRQQSREDFQRHAQELDDQVAVLERKFQAIEKRAVETERGKEQLLVAKEAAQEATNRIFGHKKIPAFCKKFVDQVWIDYLTLLQLRGEKDDSNAWQEALQLGRQILDLCADGSGGLGRTARVETVASQVRDQITAMLPHQERKINAFIDALYEPPSSGEASEVVEVEPARTRKSAPQEPADRETLELYRTLRSLPQETWFEFESGTDKAYRARLSWYNPLTDHFLFVMPRGRQSRLVEISELAKEIQAGRTKYFTNLKGSFWNRAMRSIMAMLERKDQNGTNQAV